MPGNNDKHQFFPSLNNIGDILPQVGIVINTLPETDETKEVIDAKGIRLLKNNALFVNVGRGSVIDEGALVGALLQSRIAGTVLDVTNIEPIPPESPLMGLPHRHPDPTYSGWL